MRRVSTHASGDAESRRRARVALERVARRGHGIMRRHGWVVDEPPNSRRRLLRDAALASCGEITSIEDNGSDCGLRARTGRRGTVRWMDEDRVFATFLHELAHMAIGPHDARFYALLRRSRTRPNCAWRVILSCAGGAWEEAPGRRERRVRGCGRRRVARSVAHRSTAGAAGRSGERASDGTTSGRRVAGDHDRPNSRRAAEDRARRAAARRRPRRRPTSPPPTMAVSLGACCARVFVTPNATTDAMKLARRRDKNTHDANSNASTRGDPVVRHSRRDASYSLDNFPHVCSRRLFDCFSPIHNSSHTECAPVTEWF